MLPYAVTAGVGCFILKLFDSDDGSDSQVQELQRIASQYSSELKQTHSKMKEMSGEIKELHTQIEKRVTQEKN